MPLVEHYLPAVQDIVVNGAKPYAYAPPLSMKREQVLHDGNQNNMVGVLTQIATLAAFANDIFSNLMVTVQGTATRISNVAATVERVQQQVPVLESHLQQTNLQTLLSNPRQEFSLPPNQATQLFTTENTPSAIKDLYNKASLPPPLHMLDPYRDDNKKCLELYTNPHFFLDEWIQEQLKQRQLAKEERRKRREERKKQKEAEASKANKLAPKKPTTMVRYRYDPDTGQKILIKDDEPAGTVAPSPSTRPTPTQQATSSPSTRVPETPSVLSQSTASSSSSTFYAPPPPPAFDDLPPPPLPSSDFPAPPIMSDFPPPPPPSDDFPPLPPRDSAPTLPPRDNVLPPPLPSRDNNVPNTFTPAPLARSDAPPPPPIPASTFIPAPPIRAASSVIPPAPIPTSTFIPPPPVVVEDDTPRAPSLLEQALAEKAKGLKSVQVQPTAPKKDAHSTLLEQIRSGQNLKKTESANEPKKTGGPAQPQSVAEILARRIAIQGSDDDSEDSDDEEWK